jgi:AcrR family transcriptional regulator
LPRTEQAFEAMRENTRKRILEAASSVFAKKGLGATISDIAAEAGVSQGLAYRYFSSKEAIFHTLLRQLLQAGEADKFSQDSGKPPRELLEHFVSETIRLRREHPEFYRFVFQALSDESLPRDILQMLNAHGQKLRRVLRGLITDGQAMGGVSKGDPDQLVDVILACLEGLSMRIAYSDPAHQVRLPDAEIILRLLGPSPQSKRSKA